MSLQSEIDALYEAADKLLLLGLDGTSVYADLFCELSVDVYRQSELLFLKTADSIETEAALCVSLLMGYSVTINDNGDKEEKIQSVLKRSWKVLEHLPASFLKCQLLVACYSEVFEEKLAKEAHAIMDCWSGRELTAEAYELAGRLQILEDYQYLWDEVEE